VADSYSTPGHRRFVAGSLGPGTKAPSLDQIGFAELRDHYQVAAEGLLEGGVDLFILETHFDLLALKAAMIAAAEPWPRSVARCRSRPRSPWS
jgi:5-methyltetrahydrofolate--homocysteine methyltransferase